MYSTPPESHDATRLTVADILSTMANSVDAMTPTTVRFYFINHFIQYNLTSFSISLAATAGWSYWGSNSYHPNSHPNNSPEH